MLRIKLVKSPIANTPANRATVRALGLGKVGRTVIHEDTPAIRGMIHHVKHLLVVEPAGPGELPKNQRQPRISPKVAAAARAERATAKSQGAAEAPAAPKPMKKPTAANAKPPAKTAPKKAESPAAKKPASEGAKE